MPYQRRVAIRTIVPRKYQFSFRARSVALIVATKVTSSTPSRPEAAIDPSQARGAGTGVVLWGSSVALVHRFGSSDGDVVRSGFRPRRNGQDASNVSMIG
ncbi:MAG: hypothetical protein AVDCRST_MAG87-3786 [uncultured Thermomicrobiales bacterium]|uniref:Uncharacterized protein n=1 Tax=uncultured Thermomicrobiales bacterium TaxID=1645740 RepID=A0A6J4VW61_9BACT|nr:MAG: hypothetical protein AVDCRST_MAG87-3786 [uncultured Thermomicrobiales bacterium]